MTSPALDRLRLRGMEILVALAWANVALLTLIGASRHAPLTGVALGLAATVNILPTILTLQRRHDMAARLTAGTLVAVHPALGVFLLAGHVWQMDAHMYFFVAMAALAPLCDWRPILLASALIALHHIALDIVAPGLAFVGGDGPGRVAVHAAAVALQGTVLSYLGMRLRHLFHAQEAARMDSERLADAAIAQANETAAALRARSAAETRAAAERARREQIERELAAQRRREMMMLADAFQLSVSDMVGAVGVASEDLAESAAFLDELARRASRETGDTAQTAEHSSRSVAQLAGRIGALIGSIASITARVEQQAMLSGDARALSAEGHRLVRALAERSVSIDGFAGSIDDIAARTDLLALNAAIEAARAGAAGRSFGVVAGEVKALAAQASGATEQIRRLVHSMRGGAADADGALARITGTVEGLADAAHGIRTTLDDQREATAAIESAAQETAAFATRMAGQAAAVATVAGDTEALSGRVSDAASGLTHTARALAQATERFVGQLRAA